MAHKTDILFLDIPTILGQSTSANTWKVRLALNYKGLNYKTQWVETSDLEATLKSLKVPPTTKKPNGDPKWTLPAIIDNTTSPPTILADSTPIIEYLERTYPDSDPARALVRSGSRSLHALFEYHFATSIQAHLNPLIVVGMYSKKGPRDQADFVGRLGKKPEEIALPPGEAREAAWAKIQAAFSVLAGIYAKNGGGEFIAGEHPSISDFILGGQLICFRNASPEEAWAKIQTWDDGRWARFLQALEGWTAVK